MGSILDVEVAHHCRIVCAVNLQYLKEIFKNVWAFAIAIDAGNNARTAYLDLRMRCYFKGALQNFHLLAIPMRERHTLENTSMVSLLKRLMYLHQTGDISSLV